MRKRIVFVERRPTSSPSIERVFRRVSQMLPDDEFECVFQQVPYGDGALNLFRNLLGFRREPADIYHVTGQIHYIALRLPARRTVLTIHDLILMHIRSGFRRWILKKLYLDLPVARVRELTAISQFTFDELRNFGVGRNIEVISDPAPLGFDPEPRRSFNSAAPVVLHVGTAPNKNLGALIEALGGLNCTLHVVGKLDDDSRKAIESSHISFRNDERLDETEMKAAYRNCDVVAFCSRYEGFGLPILEAQAMEKPLLTTGLQPMKDVAGDGALFVDPDAASIRAGLQTIFRDEALRQRLVDAGRRNLARFDAETIAGEYARVYRRIISR